ncbi:AAA family ATPase [Vibrio vulnificus]|uniref:AAA family ATPase n=3 Tax=Vibrio vulnificus TaxID=672 RepID=UPI0019D4541A|nr:ATP-dependent RecD-like DNA helicase [Vibrio vulnificus]
MELVLRVTSVSLGVFGGFVFGGMRIDRKAKKTYLCKAKYNICTRSPRIGEIWSVKGSETACDEYKTFITLESCSIESIETINNDRLLAWHLKKHNSFRGFGLGSKKIDKLIDAIGGSELISLLNNGNWHPLSGLVNERIAQTLTEKWMFLKNEFETIQFLTTHNIPLSVANRLLNVCRINTVERLQANPYALISFYDIIPNIWTLVDKVAQCLGIPKHDERRLIGIIEFCLYKRLQRGHTGTSCRELNRLLMTLRLMNDEILVAQAIRLALSKKVICHKNIDGTRYYQLSSVGYIEYEVEKSIRNLKEKTIKTDLFDGICTDIGSTLYAYNKIFFENNGYSLTESQLNAIAASLTNNLAVIDGYGGTGKTTILKAIADLSGERIPYILALSGKAKERAAESTGLKTYTIHDFINRLHSQKISKINKMLVVIDEASMVDILLMNKLFKALGDTDFKLIMVGDEGQLPPIGFGLCFHRLVSIQEPEILKVVKLREVHRAKSTSMLHHVSMEVREGRLPNLAEWSGENEGVYLLPCRTEKEMHQVLLSAKKMKPQAQIVTSHVTEKRIDSARGVNNFMQYSIQESFLDGRYCMQLGKTRIMENDPVIVTQNMYEFGLYNGNTGVVKSVYLCEESDEVACDVNFGDKGIISITRSNAWALGLELAYAISVHKSQGSEYDTTIVCAIEDSPLLDRSMFYTALTRSKKLTLIAGRYDVARNAVQRGNRASEIDTLFDICT